MSIGYTPEQEAHITRARGRLQVFDEVDPRRTALLVIDMQRHFLLESSPRKVAGATSIVPVINRLVDAVRDAGGTVAWIYQDNGAPAEGFDLYAAVFGEQAATWSAGILTPGSPDYELWDDLHATDDDLRVPKRQYSALIPGSSVLEESLIERGIDTIMIAGTVTNICCESTARDAAMLGYRTIMVADALAAHTDTEHMGTLVTFHRCFGDVKTTDEIVSLLEVCSKG